MADKENLVKDTAEAINSEVSADESVDSSGVEATSSEGKTEEKAQDPVEKLEAEVAQWKERYAYLSADVENIKKRQIKERADTLRFANEGLLQKIFPVIDNLNLAILAGKNVSKTSSAEKTPAFDGLMTGVEMTLKQFEQTMSDMGVSQIDASGKVFDPTVHEAMGQSQDEKFQDGVVTSVFQQGYILNGRVVRPAKVIVNQLSTDKKTDQAEK